MALFNGTIFVSYIVKPISYFVTRSVTTFEDGSFIEEYSNGTTISFAPPLDPRANDLDRAFYVVKDEFNTINGTGRRFFFNGTVIATLNGAFVRVLVPPKSFYYGCVKVDLDDGTEEVRCWNQTYRKYDKPTFDETDEERATGIWYTEYYLNKEGYTVFFRNGTIATWDALGNMKYIKPPQYFYSKNTTLVQEDGSIEI